MTYKKRAIPPEEWGELAEFVMKPVLSVSVNSEQRDFLSFEEDLGNSKLPWDLISKGKLNRVTKNGLFMGVGSLILRYRDAENVKEFLMVKVDYEIVTDVTVENFLEETWTFTPYGDRWQRSGLQFPSLSPIVNPGSRVRMDFLSSTQVQNQIRIVMEKITAAIQEGERV